MEHEPGTLCRMDSSSLGTTTGCNQYHVARDSGCGGRVHCEGSHDVQRRYGLLPNHFAHLLWRCCAICRAGVGVVRAVRRPVSQAALPAAEWRRRRSWRGDADRRTVSRQRRRVRRPRTRLLDRLRRSEHRQLSLHRRPAHRPCQPPARCLRTTCTTGNILMTVPKMLCSVFFVIIYRRNSTVSNKYFALAIIHYYYATIYQIRYAKLCRLVSK